MKYIASCSFGKDSLALILKLLELNYPLDEVIFYDSGVEFQAIYNNKNKLKPILESKNITFTELKPTYNFIYLMTEKPVNKRDFSVQNGYKWCGGRCRWGTTYKLQAIKNHYKQYNEFVVEYVGPFRNKSTIFELENQFKNQSLTDKNSR